MADPKHFPTETWPDGGGDWASSRDGYRQFTQEEVDELMGNEPAPEWTEADERGWQEVLDVDKYDTDE